MRYAAHYRPTHLPGATPAGQRRSPGTRAATVGKIHPTVRYRRGGLTLWAARAAALIVGTDLVHASPTPLRSHGSLSMNRALMAAGLVDRSR
jgi:hypothetical protein